ncbi:MAG TPA: UvrD-helicase domain-containing protein, partial [Dehalococcoidia bacterium]|nr:UvrD-helicase domain-containing protein [Dehalococcoidia bacterium]
MEDLRDPVLADEQARHLVRSQLAHSMLVEAGAGTGKTSALMDRYVSLVLSGVPVERIVAITFTEKAAAEMRERVRTGLEKAAQASDDSAMLAQRALDNLDRGQISTIHSFCQALLKAFAAEAAIDPDFTVLDEVRGERRFLERWRRFLERIATEPEAVRAFDRVLGLGISHSNLEDLARTLFQKAEALPLLETLTPPAPVWSEVEEMRQEMAELPLHSVPEDDRLLQRLQPLRALLDDLKDTGDEREAMLTSYAAIFSRDNFSGGRKENWGGRQVVEAARETGKGIYRRLNALLSACRSQALAQLLPLLVRFVREEAKARGREGELTFADLILRVRDLLLQSPEAVRSLRRRYDALLIDEFQDTDPLQMEIARLFACDPVSGQLEGGRLFLVGDPKQSIYRFRRADMASYHQVRSLLEGQGALLPSLALNRRSQAPLLDWVNQVFATLFGLHDNVSLQPPYHAIHSERRHGPSGPGVARVGGALAAYAREVREEEARAIAACCQAVLQESWQVSERDGSLRPAALRDIAVLIPARTGLLALERALADAAIPYGVEGGSLVYRTQDLRDIINCLTAIDDPADEVAVVAALRSPAFACSDIDLALHRAQGGSFNYLASLDGQEGIVAEGLRVLHAYHQARHDLSLAALAERFIGERGLLETGVLDRGDRNAYRRLHFLVEQARQFEENGPQSLRAFVRWLEQQSGAAVLQDEGAGLDDDEDAVRIFTVHGAKGLEFPIVFLAGLGSAPNTRPSSPCLVDHIQERAALEIGARNQNARFTLGPVEDLRSLEQAHAEAEYVRLLYVAATRARDHLV